MTKAKLVIEEGNYYRLGIGDIVGPLVKNPYGYFHEKGADIMLWDSTGQHKSLLDDIPGLQKDAFNIVQQVTIFETTEEMRLETGHVTSDADGHWIELMLDIGAESDDNAGIYAFTVTQLRELRKALFGDTREGCIFRTPVAGNQHLYIYRDKRTGAIDAYFKGALIFGLSSEGNIRGQVLSHQNDLAEARSQRDRAIEERNEAMGREREAVALNNNLSAYYKTAEDRLNNQSATIRHLMHKTAALESQLGQANKAAEGKIKALKKKSREIADLKNEIVTLRLESKRPAPAKAEDVHIHGIKIPTISTENSMSIGIEDLKEKITATGRITVRQLLEEYWKVFGIPAEKEIGKKIEQSLLSALVGKQGSEPEKKEIEKFDLMKTGRRVIYKDHWGSYLPGKIYARGAVSDVNAGYPLCVINVMTYTKSGLHGSFIPVHASNVASLFPAGVDKDGKYFGRGTRVNFLTQFNTAKSAIVEKRWLHTGNNESSYVLIDDYGIRHSVHEHEVWVE